METQDGSDFVPGCARHRPAASDESRQYGCTWLARELLFSSVMRVSLGSAGVPMRFALKIGVVTLALVAAFVSACGASSTSSGDEGAGADSGASGQGGSGGGSGSSQAGVSGTGTGGSGIGGTGGVAGTGGCGPCLRIACAPPVWLMIVPDASVGAGPIADLTVDVPGLSLTCNWNGSPTSCQWTCQAFQTVPGGHYTATISAPGFETQTVEFDINSPTNCGCCGCPCGGSFQSTVMLHPTGEPSAGCCTALDRDPNNCGSCGKVCPVASCQDGKCGPAFGACIAGGLGFTSCDAYCESLDLSCAAACGTNGDLAMTEWVGDIANCAGDPNIMARSGTCSEPFAMPGPSRPDYQCCCEEP
jgi:hypothetical protein